MKIVNDKQHLVAAVRDEINPIKSDLIKLAGRLEDAGAVREARSLDTIIGKLEAWQNR